MNTPARAATSAAVPIEASRQAVASVHSQEHSVPDIHKGIERFLGWLKKNGCESYDPYDLWGTRYGLTSRALYYRKNPIGLALIAPLIAIDIFIPGIRSLFVKKDRFATADAQLALAMLNLFRDTGEQSYLAEARRIAEEMLSYSIPGYSGHCWGYPFDWQNQRGLWRKNTPYITCTPYCFEVYLGLHNLTGELRYLEIARSIARFVHDDLKEIHTSATAAAGSYSPKDGSQVVNAGAYRAMVLFEAADALGEESYRVSAIRNLNYILESQREDGSWLYATDGHGNFIDHFHTCFVLKNLIKINRHLNDPRVTTAIHRGWQYYRKHLFDSAENPKTYTIQPRTQIVRLEMYNFAEAITLGAMLRDEVPEAHQLALRLATRLCRDFQLPQGYFVTRVFLGGIRHTFPFIRWPQAQLFYALTSLHAGVAGVKLPPTGK